MANDTKKPKRSAGRSTPASRAGAAGRRNAETTSEAAGQAMDASTQATRRTAQAAGEIVQAGTDASSKVANLGARVGENFERQFREAGDEWSRQLGTSQQAAETMTGSYRNLLETTQRDMDALVQSSARLAQGLQQIGMRMFCMSQTGVQAVWRAAASLAQARTAEDIGAIQRQFFEDSIQSISNDANELMHLSAEMTGDVMAPLQGRLGSGRFDEAGKQIANAFDDTLPSISTQFLRRGMQAWRGDESG